MDILQLLKRVLKHEYFWLAVIFLAVFFFRLFFVMQTDWKSFSSDDAYFHLRKIESLKENFDFKLQRFDELSYSGRVLLYPPLYHYIFGFLSLLFGLTFVLKILPELLISIMTIIVYYLSKGISGSKLASLTSSFMSGFTPALFGGTLNQLSIYSIAFPMFFLMVYYMMDMRLEKQKLTYFAILAILFPLLHSSSFLLVLSLIVYILIIASESWTLRKLNKEAIIFCMFITFLIQFFLFKEAFFIHGISMVWAGTPELILRDYFGNLDVLSTIYKIGVMPLIFGVSGLFIGFKKRSDKFFLLVGVLFSVFFLLLLKLITLSVGLMFLAAVFCILSSISLKWISSYLRLTKFFIFRGFFITLLFVLLGITLIVPSFNLSKEVLLHVPLAEDILALEWMAENIDENATILAPLGEGHLVTAITKKKNIVDDIFLLAPKAGQRVADADLIYSTGSEIWAIETLDKYKVDYIFLSEKSKQKYGILDLRYADNKCFTRVKYEEPKIYRFRC